MKGRAPKETTRWETMQMDAVKINIVVAPKPKNFTMRERLASVELISSAEKREEAVTINKTPSEGRAT